MPATAATAWSPTPSPSPKPEGQFDVVSTLPTGDVARVLDGVILTVDMRGASNTISITKNWGRETVVMSKEVALTDFVVNTATLVTDGTTVSIVAGYAWSSPAEGINRPVCHTLARQYTLDLTSKIWEGEMSATETAVGAQCQPPSMGSTTDGRGVIVLPENLWFSVSTHQLHRVTKGSLQVAGPMIAAVVGAVGTDQYGATMVVYDPITEGSISVLDKVPANQDDPTPGQLYRQLAAYDQRLASWLDDHTVILGVANPSPNSKVPISSFNVRTGTYRVLFWVEGYGAGYAHTTAVDAESGTVLLYNGAPYSYDPLDAYSLAGKKLWTLKDASVCAVGGGYAVIQANGQLATLNSASGEQVSYSTTERCIGTVEAKYLLRDGAQGTDIVRILP